MEPSAHNREANRDSEEVRTKLREFVRHKIAFGDESVTIEDDTPLLNGLMDSFALVSIVAFVEKEFKIRVLPSEMTGDNFGSLAVISRLISSKTSK